MCRKKVKESHIDTSLIFAYAKSEQYAALEEFISAPNVGRIQDVAEGYGEAMYEAAKILFNSISNFARLATCLMHLGQHQAAVDARARPTPRAREGGQRELRRAQGVRRRRSARCTSSSTPTSSRSSSARTRSSATSTR